MTPFFFTICTFGCKVSQYESQAVREHWERLGGVETEEAGRADVVLVASCAVTAEAVSDARQMVRRLGREAPRAKILVTGCAAAAEPADFSLPGVSAVLPQRDKPRLLNGHPLEDDFRTAESPLPARNTADAAEAAAAPVGKDPVPGGHRIYPPFRIRGYRRARPVLKVQDGCSHRCAYCIVPLTRGPACSRDPDDAVAETRRLLEAGHREIMISGINLRQYHCEGVNFWGLLQRIDAALAPEWTGRARLRLSSLEPAQLNAEGLETLEACRLLCPHLHLSLQSGSPSVLRRMGREHYSPEKIREVVERLRAFWPVFGLGADILTGFPGETGAEAEETLRMVELLPLTYAHVFPWSSRPGTRAASMPGALPRKLRQERAARVRALVADKREMFLRSLLSSTIRVALDGDGSRLGVNEFYAPCIVEDGDGGPELIACRADRIDNGRLACARIGGTDR